MMSRTTDRADFRIEKVRVAATLTLSNGERLTGSLFLGADARRQGRERVDELLNGEPGFLPFERDQAMRPQVALYNRDHIVLLEFFENDARTVPGYEVATRHHVSVVLSTNQRFSGLVSVHQSQSYDRLSDWARDPTTFRYVETDVATLLVNAGYITALIETASE
jgi:hypothetical protein